MTNERSQARDPLPRRLARLFSVLPLLLAGATSIGSLAEEPVNAVYRCDQGPDFTVRFQPDERAATVLLSDRLVRLSLIESKPGIRYGDGRYLLRIEGPVASVSMDGAVLCRDCRILGEHHGWWWQSPPRASEGDGTRPRLADRNDPAAAGWVYNFREDAFCLRLPASWSWDRFTVGAYPHGEAESRFPGAHLVVSCDYRPAAATLEPEPLFRLLLFDRAVWEAKVREGSPPGGDVSGEIEERVVLIQRGASVRSSSGRSSAGPSSSRSPYPPGSPDAVAFDAMSAALDSAATVFEPLEAGEATSTGTGRLRGEAEVPGSPLLPPGSELVVRIEEVRSDGEEALVLATSRVSGSLPDPIRFELRYAVALVQPHDRYRLRAEVVQGDRVLFWSVFPRLSLQGGRLEEVRLLLRSAEGIVPESDE